MTGILPVSDSKPYQLYIRYLQGLKRVREGEYKKVPPSLRILKEEEIERLSPAEVLAYQIKDELPGSVPDSSSDEVEVAKAYLGQLLRLKEADQAEYAKIPAVLQELSQEEIRKLTLPQVQALKMTGALPYTLIPGKEVSHSLLDGKKMDEAIGALCRQYPDLQEKVNAWQQDPGNARKLEAILCDPRVQTDPGVRLASEELEKYLWEDYLPKFLEPFGINPMKRKTSLYRCQPYHSS